MADEVPQSPENTAGSQSTPRDDASYDGDSPGPWARPADRAPEPADTVPSSGSPVWGAAPEVPLDKSVGGAGAEGVAADPVPPVAHRPDPNPWAPPADGTAGARSGPGDTVFAGPADTVPSSGSPVWGAAPEVPLDKSVGGAGAEGVAADPVPPAGHRPDPNPWAPPADGTAGDTVFAGPAGTPAPSFLHDRQTVTSVPADPPPPAWANPFAPPTPPVGQSEPVNPFAPPGAGVPYLQGAAVPPPPIAPDGPGRVPYGYPGTPVGYGGHGPAPQAFPSGYYGWPGMQPMPSNGMGTAGLVLGIVSAIGFCLWPVAIVLGVLGVIFGGIGRGKASRGEASNPGQALAGIICGSVGTVLALVIIAFQISSSG